MELACLNSRISHIDLPRLRGHRRLLRSVQSDILHFHCALINVAGLRVEGASSLSRGRIYLRRHCLDVPTYFPVEKVELRKLVLNLLFNVFDPDV